jgi:hypothetical protein
MADDGIRKLEGYLDELRAQLRGLPEPETSEIIKELRSHVLDSAGVGGSRPAGAVAAALDRLGSPEELAELYRMESMLTRAGRSRSPWLIFGGILRWATVSVAGILPFLGVLAGLVVAASFAIAALFKPFAPGRVGLWRGGGDELSLHLGLLGGPPPQGQELLGWWIVPLGLLAGAGVVLFTAWFGRWCARRYRRMSPGKIP